MEKTNTKRVEPQRIKLTQGGKMESNCRSCGREMVWGMTADGKKIPLSTFDSGNIICNECRSELGNEA